MSLTVADVLAATGGCLRQGRADVELAGVSTDTRTLAPAELFLAIRGERHDAHDYLAAAAEAGAAAFVVERWPVPCPQGLPVVQVGDSVRAYGRIAAWWRGRMPACVVGLTGSNGKTTVKEMIACLLGGLGPTLASAGNHNNHIGVPETLLRMRPEHSFAVVEMGTNHPGEIPYLADLVRPNVALITNVGPTHLEAFGSEYGVQCEKARLLASLAPGGVAVLHACPEDPWSRAIAADHAGPTVTFGSASDATWRATDVEVGEEAVAFRVGRSPVRFEVPAAGAWQVDNALAALAVACELGLDLSAAAERFGRFVPPALRMNVRRVGDLRLIVDCYNANPASLRAALGDLVRRPAARRVAVLGDMLELGRVADAEHHAVGELVGSSPIELLCAVGERAPLVVRAARAHGMSSENAEAVADNAAAAAWLRHRLEPDDTVLFKGSRSMRLEQVVEAVEAWARDHVPVPVA